MEIPVRRRTGSVAVAIVGAALGALIQFVTLIRATS
jgi:hypothetical protein